MPTTAKYFLFSQGCRRRHKLEKSGRHEDEGKDIRVEACGFEFIENRIVKSKYVISPRVGRIQRD